MTEPPTEQISVLIVDDHDVVRKGVRGYLEAQPDISIAGEAASGKEAVRGSGQQVKRRDLLGTGMGFDLLHELNPESTPTQCSF